MKKRSKYRPKPVLVNPVMFVLESFRPVREHDSYLMDLKIRNHSSMTALTRGVATREDMDELIRMVNVVEALYRLGFGDEYGAEVDAGLVALRSVGRRGHESGRFILKAQEMTDLNTVMELHDAQMELITIKDMDKALDMITKEFQLRKMHNILEKT